MKNEYTHSGMVEHRGELMAELLLQDLGPTFVARAERTLGYDYFAGFPNSKGGINVTAVEVKATDRPVPALFPIDRRSYDSLAHSNIPVLVVVADVKQNRLYYGWPQPHGASGRPGSHKVAMPLVEINDHTKAQLRGRLVG
jgi:hypothetical protein